MQSKSGPADPRATNCLHRRQCQGPGAIVATLALQGLRLYVEYSFTLHRISGLVVEYIVAIDVTRVRFPADALLAASYG